MTPRSTDIGVAMKTTVQLAYRTAMHEARDAQTRGDLDSAFNALERAHILGQRYLIPHVVTHVHMLCIGLRRRDTREIAGQILRLAATLPGYLTGWVPKGNPGGANISALRAVPLRGDLVELLEDYSVWRDVGLRLSIYVVAAVGWLAVSRGL